MMVEDDLFEDTGPAAAELASALFAYDPFSGVPSAAAAATTICEPMSPAAAMMSSAAPLAFLGGDGSGSAPIDDDDNDSYELTIAGEPNHSLRVENQLKLGFCLARRRGGAPQPLRWDRVLLPPDMCTCAAKPSVAVSEGGEERATLLCEVAVFCATGVAPQQAPLSPAELSSRMPALCCPHCAARERRAEERRLSRRRGATPLQQQQQQQQQQPSPASASSAAATPSDGDEGVPQSAPRRKVVVFCCDPDVRLSVSGEFVIPLRFVCYCSHHGEKTGFCLNVVLRDALSGAVVAKAVSRPILVRDDHKSSSQDRRKAKRQRTEEPLAHQPVPVPQQQQQQQPSPEVDVVEPRIMKVAPNQGPIAGGITVMVAGVGFLDGHKLSFGPYLAQDTALWSEGTLMCTLPPATQEGVVRVAINNVPSRCQTDCQLFTYIDDTDVRLMRLALQTVGSKLLGRNESPKTIAMTILEQSGYHAGSSQQQQQQQAPQHQMHPLSSSAGRNSIEAIVLRALSVVNRMRGERIDISLREPDTERNLAHLAAIKGYVFLLAWLLKHGASPLCNAQDAAGNTPLHYSSLYNRADCTAVLLRDGADPMSANDSMQLPADLTSDRSIRCALTPLSLSSAESESCQSRLSSMIDLPSHQVASHPPLQQQQQQQQPPKITSATVAAAVAGAAVSPRRDAPAASTVVEVSAPGTPQQKRTFMEVSQPPSQPAPDGVAKKLPAWLRTHVRQAAIFAFVTLVGIAMLSTMVLRPGGFSGNAYHNATLGSSWQALNTESEYKTDALRIISAVALSLAFAVNVFVYTKSQRTWGVLVFAGLLLGLDVYEIVMLCS